ncbi:hypothetical protein [Streptomyces geranii]|uniref:hypothetical protein n=1 Tax=Streptomyces geranii TaxID=2058923 RepID=UPI000D02E1D6|nr:hypothetical protein [Streptomyces geranii]
METETALDNIGPELDNYVGAKRALVDTMTRAFRSGVPAMAVWRSVATAFSRDQVKEYLAAIALMDSARKAVEEAGLAASVDVSATGIDAPREARLTISADPAETPDYPELPGKIRDALRDFHITLTKDFPRDEDNESDDLTDSLIDELLLDGEQVRLVKLKPRT